MKIIFEKEYLEELYFFGYTRKKKYRYPKGIIKKYVKTIDLLIDVCNIDVLNQINGLNYKTLKGSKSNIESVRINDQYRLEFKTLKSTGDIKVIYICSIIELSKHYQ